MILPLSFIKKLTGLIFLLAAGPLSGQSFIIQPYTTANGLPDNVIYGVTQDKEGFLWIATGNGLSRYDGTEFKSYGFEEKLPSLSVNGIYEDSIKRLWVYTRNGFARLKNDSCILPVFTGMPATTFVNQITEPGNKRLWALTNNGSYSLENNTWKNFTLIPEYGEKTLISATRNKQGLILNYNNVDLVQLSDNGQKTVLATHAQSTAFFNSIRRKNDTVYAGGYHGIYRIDGNKLTSLFADSLSKRYIYGFFIDSKNRFWISTREDGILLVIPGSETTTYQKIPVAFNLIYDFYEDRDQNIWVCSLNGLLRIKDASYQTFSLPVLKQSGDIRNIIALPGGELLVSCSAGKLFVLSNNAPAGTPALVRNYDIEPNDFVDYYSVDEQQRMWMCTRESKLYRLDKKGISDFTSLVRIPQSIRSVYYDIPTSKLYVSVDSVLMTGDEKKIDTLKETGTGHFISLPSHISRIPGGNILVSTLRNGIIEITPDGKFRTIYGQKNLPENVSYSQFRVSPDQKLWISEAGYRLMKFINGPTGGAIADHLEEYPSNIRGDLISEYLFDAGGHIWMITKRAVTLLESTAAGEWKHRVFETGDDLKQTELFFSKLTEDSYGNIWISARDKILRFQQTAIRGPSLPPSVIIEKMLLFNKATDWNSRGIQTTTNRDLPVDPVMKYNENSVNIYFKGIKFTNGEAIEYCYRLLPSDSVWSEPGTSNSISLYKLRPGAYRFMVRSRNRDGEWSEPASLNFTIQKPFWDTWLFRVFVILFGSGIIVGLFRYRLKQLRNKTAMIQQVRELEMKTLKAQMNPHFIHNALNSIQSLILNNKSSEASHYISQFARLLRLVLENTDMNLIPLEKELSFLQLYADLEKFRMNMEVEFSIAIDPELSASQTKIPPFILQPFVENALWHGLSQKEGEKIISIRIFPQDDHIICEITDNGIGREKAAVSYHNFPEGHLAKALTITSQRLIDFNKSSNPEPITFTDLQENGEPAGTRVIIRLRKQF